MKYAVYSRKSKFTGKGESIENQIQLCKEYLGRLNHDNEITIEVFEDEGFSGKNINRPEFQRMISSVKKKEFDCIVCYRLDRISRSVSDFANLIDSLSKWGVGFICIREQFDTTSPMGRAMMHIASVFAQLERETIAERIRDNMVLLAKTGRWLGGATPFGFQSMQVKNINIDGKTKTSFKLSPVKEEIEIIKLIYELYLKHHSLTKIETFFAQSGIKTRGGKIFKTIGIREILSNPVYCIADGVSYDYFYENGAAISVKRRDFLGETGISTYNRTKNSSGWQKKQPISEWIIAVGKHEGIVPSEDWIEIQTYLNQNKLTYNYYKPQNPIALLSGVLVCNKCGSPMRPRLSSYRTYKKWQPYDTRTYAYQCELKRISKKAACDCPNINGNILDKTVCDELLKCEQFSSDMVRQLESLKSCINDDGNIYQKKSKMLELIIEEKTLEIKQLITILSKESDNSRLHQYTKDEVENLGNQITLLKQELDKNEDEAKEADDCGICSDILGSNFQQLDQALSVATTEEKRILITSIIERITWDGDEVNIFLY